MLTLERAVAIATAAHAGQVDKNGVTPYIEHPLAVMGMVEGEDAKIVAVLHDVLEDTEVTLGYLVSEGLSMDQVAALLAVTRRPGEAYAAYMPRAMSDPIGRVVKLADHDHNTDPERLSKLSPEDAQRLSDKYEGMAFIVGIARETERWKANAKREREYSVQLEGEVVAMRALIQELFDYTCEVEQAMGPWPGLAMLQRTEEQRVELGDRVRKFLGKGQVGAG